MDGRKRPRPRREIGTPPKLSQADKDRLFAALEVGGHPSELGGCHCFKASPAVLVRYGAGFVDQYHCVTCFGAREATHKDLRTSVLASEFGMPGEWRVRPALLALPLHAVARYGAYDEPDALKLSVKFRKRFTCMQRGCLRLANLGKKG